MRRPAALMLLVLAIGWPALAGGEVLLRDDFDGTALDTAKWFVPTGPGTFFGRTQIRPPSLPLPRAQQWVQTVASRSLLMRKCRLRLGRSGTPGTPARRQDPRMSRVGPPNI